MRTRGHRHRGVLLPRRRAHREGRHVHQHPAHGAVAPQGPVEPDGRAAQRPVVRLPPRPSAFASVSRTRATSDGPARARADLGLPDRGPARGAQCRRGARGDQRTATPTGSCCPATPSCKADGSTSCGCWIYCGCYAGGVNQTARRKPASEQNWTGSEWAWAWPANRRILYNRASADPQGRPVERAQGARLVGCADRANGPGTTRPISRPTSRPTTARRQMRADPTRSPATTRSSCRPTVAAGCSRPRASPTARCRPTTSRRTRRCATRCTRRQRNPARQVYEHENNRYHPDPDEPGRDVFPFVVTTYRLTEHFTAGGMSRWTPYLAELQPEFFCEVSPELAAERGLAARRLGDARQRARGDRGARDGHRPDDPAARRRAHRSTRSACPTTGARTATRRGDSMNELSSMALDPSSHIQEVKALTVDIRPGRRPRGPARQQLVREYRQPRRHHRARRA